MHTNRKRLIVLRSYFLLCAIDSIFVVFLLWRAIGRADNVSLFEFPNAWLGYMVITGIAAVIFIFLTIQVFRRSVRNNLLALIETYLNQVMTQRVLAITGVFLYIIGAIYWFSSSPIIYGPTYKIWLAPLFFWLMSLSLLTLVHLAFYQVETALRNVTGLILLLAIITSGVLVNLQFWSYDSPRKEDIFFTYLDGERLLEGVNPYERVLAGDMRVNDKYSTYFPIFYYLSWGTQRLGLRVFADWLSLWRVVFLIANLTIALLLFFIPDPKRLIALSVFGSLFWLFNRWTLHVSKTADIDFLPLLLMLLSLFVYRRHAKMSYLILGLSLGIKQMALFLVPIYLIWTWRDSSRSGRVKNLLVAVVLIGTIPLISSLPFLIWNWEGFYRSILFSATRDAAAAFEVYSLDAVLGMRGIIAKIPMLVMFAVVYWLTWKIKFVRYTPALLAMAVFVFFNSVFFTSYMIWVVALIPLAASEYIIALRDDALSE